MWVQHVKWKVGKLTPPSPEAGAQPGAPNSSVKVGKGLHRDARGEAGKNSH